MKIFVGFYYRCSFNFCFWAFLSLIGFMFLPSSAFAQTYTYGDFTYTVSGSTVTITKYTGSGGAVVIPPAIDGMPVVGIGYEAFAWCGLTSVTIGNGVTTIGDEAFYDTGLTSVTIPDSVVSIGNKAFSYCYHLTSLTIGNSVTSIGYEAFWYCESLTNVTIPNSVMSIGDRAFMYCTSLTSIGVDASNNVYSSQGGVLYNKARTVLIECPGGLTSVTIPNSVTSIVTLAFANCRNLTSVTIPSSVTSIGDNAFAMCYNLTSIGVDASNNVYSSQGGVLYNKARTVLIECPGGLTSVTIPNSVTSIGYEAFAWCGLTSVTIGNGVTTIGDEAFYDTGLTSVTIPDSVVSIGNKAFSYCYHLTSLTIGNSVTSIGYEAFWYCESLTNVTIPNSVMSIGDRAFMYCTSLTSAYFYGNAPSMGSSVFNRCVSNFSICYTAGSTGFTTPTWYGYPASACAISTSSTTTVSSITTTTVQATAITLASFTAKPFNGEVVLSWSTESEIDNAGFNLYRAESEDGEYTKINDDLISAKGSSTQGASYEYIDNDVLNRKTYYYKLEDIELNGKSTMHGPVSATPRLIYGIEK